MERDDPTPEMNESGPIPLTVLIDAPATSSDRFLERVRVGVERRLLVSHVATGLWTVPLTVLMEFLLLGLGLVGSRRPPRSR